MRPDLNQRYTDAPQLQKNLFIGSFRLLFWLFVHPAAWRNYLARIDSNLPPDFCVAQLKRHHWKNIAFLRFLFMTGFAWPVVVAFFLVVLMRLLNLPTSTIFLGVMLGVTVGVILGLAATLAGSVAISVPVGIAIALTVGLGSGLVINTTGEFLMRGTTYSIDIVVSALIGVMSGLAGGLAYGVGMGITQEKRDRDVSVSLLREVSGIIVGIFIGLGIGWLATLIRFNWLSSLFTAVLFGIAVGWRTLNWRGGILAGSVLALVMALTGGLANAGMQGGLPQFMGLLVFMTAVFAFPYVLAEKLAGAWSGGMAGALATGAGLFLVITEGASFAPFLAFGLAGILLGLTLAWWRPVLLYPFLLVWNRLLLSMDKPRIQDNNAMLVFRWHSAFWDEFQRLPLLNLDDYLLRIVTADLNEGRTAMAYLSTTRQRWAAQEAQIELDAQHLEDCTNVKMIADVHPGLATSDLVGPASALLRSFSRVSTDVAAALQQESAFNQRLALTAVEERLDTLLRELTRSDEQYAERFRPVAALWRQVVASQSRQLAEEAEMRQEIDNPYIIGVPLTEKQEIFIGRTEVSSHIEQLLLDRRRPPLLLYGQRRVGKTSLLNNLGRLLPTRILPMFVDLQGPASRAQDEVGFLYNIGRAMRQSALKQRDMTLPELTREMLQLDPFTQFEEWLDEVELRLGDNLALLMLDEFEALERVLAKARLDEEIVLGMMRHLIQHRPRFKVLLSGSHTLDEFQRWASYLINVQVIHIGYLSESEARQLVEAPVQDFALRYEPAASQRVLELTNGHPFLVQLLCAEIVALKNEQLPAQRRLATLADVETAVPEALAHGSFFFADIKQNQVDMLGRYILDFMAQEGEGIPVSLTSLQNELKMETAVLESKLQSLQHRELIVQIDAGYRFQVEMVRRAFLS